MNSEKKTNQKKSETLTLDPDSDELRKEKESKEIQIGLNRKENQEPNRRRGKGERTYLAVRRDGPSPAREKKGRAGGQLLAGLSHGGAAARPLDGGVLTRWGARAPARRPTTVP